MPASTSPGSLSLIPRTPTASAIAAKFGFLNSVPNKVSLSGHTDTAPYAGGDGYSNWELSSGRANAARRALVAGGMQEHKVALVIGLADSVLFDKSDPRNPINRRISIVVMNKAAEKAALGFRTIYLFCAELSCADGANPSSSRRTRSAWSTTARPRRFMRSGPPSPPVPRLGTSFFSKTLI